MDNATLVLPIQTVLENFAEDYPEATPAERACYFIHWMLEVSHFLAVTYLPEEQQAHYDRICDEIAPYINTLAEKKIS